jgi:hypothetical protein
VVIKIHKSKKDKKLKDKMAIIYKTPKQKNKETKLILITYGGRGGRVAQ